MSREIIGSRKIGATTNNLRNAIAAMLRDMNPDKPCGLRSLLCLDINFDVDIYF